MKVFLGLVLVGIAGCGDNSKECGPGTMDEQGVCTGVAACGVGTKDDGTGTCVPDGSVVCASGTIFDAASGKCQIDPSACQDGTVVIGAACVDPTAGLTVDVEEGAEPNGFGALGEASAAPAGLVTLKASGTTVIHGKIIPADHDSDGRLDADIDAYVINAIGPTYLHITAAGLHGLAGGFLLYASNRTAADPLAGWQRFGVSLTGATSKRDVFLPAAGSYVLAIADSRSLVLGGSPVGADDNNPAFEYYASITAQALPTPTPLAFTAGKVVVTDALAPGAVRFYAPAASKAFDDAVLEMPPGAVDPADAVGASVVVLANNAVKAVGVDHVVAMVTVPAEAIAGGIASTDAVVVVVDPEYDWDLDATPFRLTITTSDTAP